MRPPSRSRRTVFALAPLLGAGAAVVGLMSQPAVAGDLPTLAGPALGTTYRVTLGAAVPGMNPGEVHREIEAVIARIDRALSTWRQDADASRFNRGPVDAWLDVSPDLVAVVAIARRVHDATGGAFDIVAAAGGPAAAMHLVETRPEPPAIRRRRADVAIDLGGIGPGYAVDAIGERLAALGSHDHLVELGGEVRAWGRRAGGEPWRIALRHSGVVVELAPGEAVATSTARAGRTPVDPRSGKVVTPAVSCATARAATCAEADARAVAELVRSTWRTSAPRMEP